MCARARVYVCFRNASAPPAPGLSREERKRNRRTKLASLLIYVYTYMSFSFCLSAWLGWLAYTIVAAMNWALFTIFFFKKKEACSLLG